MQNPITDQPLTIYLDTPNLYYLPQYEPLINEAIRRGASYKVVLYQDKNQLNTQRSCLAKHADKLILVGDAEQAAELYAKDRPNWVFFGNSFDYLELLHAYTHTAQLGHGIGPKPSYYHKSRTAMTVRFIEGALRLSTIRELYPEQNFVQVGFCKLDPLFNSDAEMQPPEDYKLPKGRTTLLYAPTFKPSSLECFPDNWPEYFEESNILIKPHHFTYERKRYEKQRRKLEKWSRFPNVHIASKDALSLLPYMNIADLMISDASSAIFEFAALDKPIVLCNFFKLPWHYRGPFKYRYNRRFVQDAVAYESLAPFARNFQEMHRLVGEELKAPERFASARQAYTRDHVGDTDGSASARILDYIENYSDNSASDRTG